MSFRISIFILYIIGFPYPAIIGKNNYNVELLDMNTKSSTPDIFDIKLTRARASRGIFGFSGVIDFKEDIDTDQALVELRVYYSPPNGFAYSLTPFHIGPTTMTRSLNNEYKLYIKDTLVECCTNSLDEKLFVSPLKARYMECENCQFHTENLPTSLRLGHYKLMLLVYEKPGMNCTIVVNLEKD
ncbi:uncharacterized protein [Musca autumnalis]|uniref:uncharacterized protein n=1 Tax=Musca autumnalis TaxID=221902 RepID=UPI003CF3C089